MERFGVGVATQKRKKEKIKKKCSDLERLHTEKVEGLERYNTSDK